MSQVPQESLRRHRQTLQPSKRASRSLQKPAKAYGSFLTPGSVDLPSVQQKDKDKVGDLVKRRLSSRFPASFNPISGSSIPALPLNATDLVASNSIPPLPPSKYSNKNSSNNKNNANNINNNTSINNENYKENSYNDNLNNTPNDQFHFQDQPSFDSNSQIPPPSSSSSFLPSTSDPDILALRDPHFNAQRYISTRLSSANDVQISNFTDKIARLKDQVAIDRQTMIYGNYRTFLAVGAQITELGGELTMLRKLVNDLHVATTAMKQDAENTMINNNSNPNSSTTSLNVPGFNNQSNSPDTLSPLPSSRNSPNNNNNFLNPHVANFSSKQNKQNNRNSVLVLESMWAQDLSGLFRSVEGAQKYLPPIPGRHVVEESAGWDQLNAATWKPVTQQQQQAVKVILLNDYLLIASARKKVKNGGIGGGEMLGVSQALQTWVADECWPLADVEIKNLNSLEGNNTNNNMLGANSNRHGFVVKKDRNVYVYSHNDRNASVRFFHAYNRLPKEMRGKGGSHGNYSGQKIISDARSRNSIYGGLNSVNEHNSFSNQSDGNNNGNVNKGHSRSVSMDIAERTRVLRDIDTLVNDLDVKIAHRNFSEAVQIIEKHNKEVANVKEVSEAAVAAARAASATSAIGGSIGIGNGVSGANGSAVGRRPTLTARLSSAHAQQSAQVMDIKVLRVQILKIKLDQRASQISSTLLHNITQDYYGPGETKNQIQLLIRLNQSEPAKRAFLTSRRQLITKRIKCVEFEGDIPNYIAQIVTIHFRMIRATVEIYQSCFPASAQASAIAEWTKKEVEDYIEVFARQLFGVKKGEDINSGSNGNGNRNSAIGSGNEKEGEEIYKKCVEITKKQAEELKAVGLNMDFLLEYVYEGLDSGKSERSGNGKVAA